MATANMYRIGDYVYFESSSTAPYHIRRIEELVKTSNGNVEAKVMCFYRRRDLPPALIELADKHLQGGVDPDQANGAAASGETCALNFSLDDLTPKQRHQLKHRELFLSRKVETVPATLIRGKCSVTLLNETECLRSYVVNDDVFFYCLVFDPNQKTLLADKGEIRIGPKYQADIPPLLLPNESDPRTEPLDALIWTPHCNLSDRQIDQFLVISRSVGTFARALDCTSSVKQPSLHMSAAAASRDITLFHAMNVLHNHNYNITDTLSSLIPSSGPVLCRDEMEEWSASEANLFEEALEKYGKDFNDIRNDFIPWKVLKNVVEYYYMWKTTDRYVQQKRVKAVEAELKLKQVYVPNYNTKQYDVKPQILANNKIATNGGGAMSGCGTNGRDFHFSGNGCEACQTANSSQWHPFNAGDTEYKLCNTCWMYWKRYGGFKVPSKLGDNECEISMKPTGGSVSDENEKSQGTIMTTPHRPHRCSIIGCDKEFKLKTQLARHYHSLHNLSVRSGSPRPIMKTRTAFFSHLSVVKRAWRRLCQDLAPPRHVGRCPFAPINAATFKQECQTRLAGKTLQDLIEMIKYKRRDRGGVTAVATRLAIARNHPLCTPEWLAPTPRDQLPQAAVKVSFPKPPKGPDGTLLYEKVPNAVIDLEKTFGSNLPASVKRRVYEDMNGVVIPQMGPPSKRVHRDPSLLAPPPPLPPPPSILAPTLPPIIAPTLQVAPALSIGPISMVSRENSNKAAAVAAAADPGIPIPLAATATAALMNGGRSRMGGSMVARTGRKQVMSWMDAPDDLYFRSTPTTKSLRKILTAVELKRAARKPWRVLIPPSSSV